jgi:hypothetical protein
MIINRIYEIKIFCRCSLFHSWSGYKLISTFVIMCKLLTILFNLQDYKWILVVYCFSNISNTITICTHISAYHIWKGFQLECPKPTPIPLLHMGISFVIYAWKIHAHLQ